MILNVYRCGEIKRLVMGLDRFRKTPCGFCFVEYYTHQDALDCMKYIGGTKLDERVIRTDLDEGFNEGRQYGFVDKKPPILRPLLLISSTAAASLEAKSVMSTVTNMILVVVDTEEPTLKSLEKSTKQGGTESPVLLHGGMAPMLTRATEIMKPKALRELCSHNAELCLDQEFTEPTAVTTSNEQAG